MRRECSTAVKNLALQAGAELAGIAPAHKLETSAPLGHRPSNLMSNAESVIVLAGGNKLNEDRIYVRELGSLSSLTYIELKDSVKLERRRTRTCISAVHEYLKKNDFRSVIETHGWSDILSFKQASYLAGLGVFGKGTFVIHPEFGTINVMACIVTDAILTYDEPLTIDLCQDCIECIRACKYGTYRKKGNAFIWNSGKCRFYNILRNGTSTTTTYGPCNGDCINVCPVGKRDED